MNDLLTEWSNQEYEKWALKRGFLKPRRHPILHPRIIERVNYRKFRRLVLQRDGYACQLCGTDRKLTLHHIKPQSHFPELKKELDNCTTLCRDCHDWEHNPENRYPTY